MGRRRPANAAAHDDGDREGRQSAHAAFGFSASSTLCAFGAEKKATA